MEQRRISEADWRIWRRLHAVALDRYCRKVFTDIAKVQNAPGTDHERYLKVYQLVKRRDIQLGEIFDGPKRSDAYFRIAAAVNARALTAKELEEFSEETQAVIDLLTGGK